MEGETAGKVGGEGGGGTRTHGHAHTTKQTHTHEVRGKPTESSCWAHPPAMAAAIESRVAERKEATFLAFEEPSRLAWAGAVLVR